ncbi:transposase [candidate division WWE3 bacterium]|nr:transposase [candidate division WWE3 bacterium]
MPSLNGTSRQYKRKTHSKDSIYHIYNRGVAKSEIFFTPQDYEFYMFLLRKFTEMLNFELYYYCLMPNHIHLCVGQKGEAHTSNFIHRIHTTYSVYINKKHERVGHLFQDRFKQSLVKDTQMFIYLGKYIHLNPVKAGLVSDPGDYKWSSCREYIKETGVLCSKEMVKAEFKSPREYLDYLNTLATFDSIQEILLE